MTYTNITNAKAQLSKYISVVSKGQHIIITKAGKPAAVLSKFKKNLNPRKSGLLKGKIKISKDFNKTPKSIINSFYK